MRDCQNCNYRFRAFLTAQTAGDLNVIAVGWSDSTATVTGVTDTLGNSYKLAVGPAIQPGVASQSIYYASNIASAAAGANVVTVTFSSPATYPDIRILEYLGADPNNPVDVVAAGNGNSATSDSGAITTSNPEILSLVPIWFKPPRQVQVPVLQHVCSHLRTAILPKIRWSRLQAAIAQL